MQGVLWQTVDGVWCYVQDEELDGVIPNQVNRHSNNVTQSQPLSQHTVPVNSPDPTPPQHTPTVNHLDPNPASTEDSGHSPLIKTATQPDGNVPSEPTDSPSVYVNWHTVSTNSPPLYEACASNTPIPNISNNTIETDRKIWRPHLPSEYIETDPAPDILDGMETIFKDYGKSLRKHPDLPPPRDDIIHFDEGKHTEELLANIRWRDCPEEHKPAFLNLIKEFWDVFAEEGLRRPILGFQCRVDTGDVKPICCKPPRYGPHEARIMENLVAKLVRQWPG